MRAVGVGSGHAKCAMGGWEWIGCWLAGRLGEQGGGDVAPAGREARATSAVTCRGLLGRRPVPCRGESLNRMRIRVYNQAGGS